jgi:protein phosphatase-4 regulatory subunit 3
MLHDVEFYEVLMSDEFVFDFVGVLEYEPEQSERVHHRELLKEQMVYREVVPIEDAAIRQKIHQTSRLGYLKDVILPRVLDDHAFSTLTSIMMQNNNDVIEALHKDQHFFAELFRRLKASKTGDEDWQDLVGFLQETCTLARQLQNVQRAAVFASLQSHGLFDVLTDILKHGDESSQLKAADVIMSTLTIDPKVIRDFMVQQHEQPEKPNMLSELMRGFLVGSDGIQATYLEILLFLMDPEAMDSASPDKDALLDIFYNKHMESVTTRISLGKKNVNEKGSSEDTVPPWSLTKIIDLLIYCVLNHQYRIKYYILRNHILQHVLHLTERKEKYVVASAIRFLRACVGLKDDFYNRYLIKSNAFALVMKVFKQNGDKYNLLNSAVLDLVDFIRRENMRVLIHHLVDEYETLFDEVYYVDTFRLLKLRYQQGMNAPQIELPHGVTLSVGHGGREIAAVQALQDSRFRRDGSMSKDEEDYFETDDDSGNEVSPEAVPHAAVAIHSPPVLHFVGSRFVPSPLANSVFTDEVDTGATHGELRKRGRSISPPVDLDTFDGGDPLKKSKANETSSGEGLTAAQRNAFMSHTNSTSEEKGEDEKEEVENIKQTVNPTSSWVTVNKSSEESTKDVS